ncbi:MAG: hypothetical protein KIG89_05225, partial [Prevotella sp.]|nr:hypothetical protein [Prevotella sp.]
IKYLPSHSSKNSFGANLLIYKILNKQIKYNLHQNKIFESVKLHQNKIFERAKLHQNKIFTSPSSCH